MKMTLYAKQQDLEIQVNFESFAASTVFKSSIYLETMERTFPCLTGCGVFCLTRNAELRLYLLSIKFG